jgi:hypothetical protein
MRPLLISTSTEIVYQFHSSIALFLGEAFIATIQFQAVYAPERPPLWSTCRSSWLLTYRFRARFPALPDFLSCSGSGTGSTQPL